MPCTACCLLLAALTRLIVHHAYGFSFGQLQCCDPSLPLHFRASFQVVCAAAAAQDNVAGVLCVDVSRGQVDCSTTRMGHLCLRPATEYQAERETYLSYHRWDGIFDIHTANKHKQGGKKGQRNAQLLYKHSLWKPSSTWNTYFTKHTCSLWAQSSSNEI